MFTGRHAVLHRHWVDTHGHTEIMGTPRHPVAPSQTPAHRDNHRHPQNIPKGQHRNTPQMPHRYLHLLQRYTLFHPLDTLVTLTHPTHLETPPNILHKHLKMHPQILSHALHALPAQTPTILSTALTTLWHTRAQSGAHRPCAHTEAAAPRTDRAHTHADGRSHRDVSPPRSPPRPRRSAPRP